MEIQIKHLAPYLPYSLKFKTNFDHIQYLMTSLNIHKSKVTFRAVNNFKNSKTKIVKLLGENKPILKNLKDLRKPAYLDVFAQEDIDNILEAKILDKSLEVIEFYLVQKLISLHFDVFGLIDEGLAYEYK